MKPIPKPIIRNSCNLLAGAAWVVLAALLPAGCQSSNPPARDNAAEGAAPPVVATAPMATTTPAPAAKAAVTPGIIRINAGASAAIVDAGGNTWLADQGFAGGETSERDADLPIANTQDPALYRTERYSMTAFAQPVPNGKYTVKLHFAETYDAIREAGERVFSFNVEGREFKDFDVFAQAGGANKAYVETVKVEVTDGQLDIGFTSNIQNPQINALEIIPAW